jgi:hypothetical protein
MKKRANKIIGLIITLNLLLASGLSYAQSTTGSVEITPCVINCFTFEVPSNLPITTPVFLSNTESYLQISDPGNVNPIHFPRFNYNIAGGQILVRDLRTTNTGWDVYVNASNFIKCDPDPNPLNPCIPDPTKYISYKYIGIISFNNSAGTVDSNLDKNIQNPNDPLDDLLNDPTVISKIDPTTLPIMATEPFDQTAFDSLNLSIDPLTLKQYFTFFTGAGADSDPVSIMSAPHHIDNPAAPNLRPGTYTMGLGLIIKTPDTPGSTLSDGDYQLNLTFTLLT